MIQNIVSSPPANSLYPFKKISLEKMSKEEILLEIQKRLRRIYGDLYDPNSKFSREAMARLAAKSRDELIIDLEKWQGRDNDNYSAQIQSLVQKLAARGKEYEKALNALIEDRDRYEESSKALDIVFKKYIGRSFKEIYLEHKENYKYFFYYSIDLIKKALDDRKIFISAEEAETIIKMIDENEILWSAVKEKIDGLDEFKKEIRNIEFEIARKSKQIIEAPEYRKGKTSAASSIVGKGIQLSFPSSDIRELNDKGFTGKGVGIVIIDTGFSKHPDFEGRIKAYKDFANDTDEMTDKRGHGTHVAGIAAGSGKASNGRFRGVAPEADIIILNIFNNPPEEKNDNTENPAGVIIRKADRTKKRAGGGFKKALQWILDNKEKYAIRIINTSIGVSDSEWELAKDEVEKIFKTGIIWVSGAGNMGGGLDEDMEKRVNYPARDPRVTFVACSDTCFTDDASDDFIPPFSSWGQINPFERNPDVTAPGSAIASALAQKSYLSEIFKDFIIDTNGDGIGDYIHLSGTSMATAYVSGVAAIAVQINPEIGREGFRRIIRESSKPMKIIPAYIQGCGVIDPRAAVKEAFKLKNDSISLETPTGESRKKFEKNQDILPAPAGGLGKNRFVKPRDSSGKNNFSCDLESKIRVIIRYLGCEDSGLEEKAYSDIRYRLDAVPVLIKIMADQKSTLRNKAAIALDIICSAQKNGKEEFPEVTREQASTLLILLKNDEGLCSQAAAEVLGYAKIDESKIISALGESLRRPELRFCALESLAMFGPAAASFAPAAAELLKDENESVREAACRALGSMGETGAIYVKEIIKLLDDESIRVRSFAIETLGSFRGKAKEAVPYLLKFYDRPWDKLEPCRSQEALGKIGKNSIPALTKMLNSGNIEKMKFALRALRKVFENEKGSKEVFEKIVEMARHRNSEIRLNAVNELSELKQAAGQALPEVIKAFGDGDARVRGIAFIAFYNIVDKSNAPEGWVSPIMNALKDNNPAARRFSALTLGKMKISAAIPEIEKLLDDPEKLVREDAVAALGEMGRDALPILLKKWKTCDIPMKEFIVRAFISMGIEAKDSIPVLAEVLNLTKNTETSYLKWITITALEVMAPLPDEALKAIEAAANNSDEDIQVRKTAKKVIDKINFKNR